MQIGRKKLVGAIAGVALVVGAGTIPSSPAHAKPSIKDAQAQVDSLYHQAEVASERYNNAKIRLAKLQSALKDLSADKLKQGQQLAGVRQQLQASVLNQYEDSGVSVVGQVVTSDDPEAFLDGLSSLSSYNTLQGNLMSQYSTEVQSLDIRSSATARRIADVAATKAQLKSDKTEIDQKLAQAKTLLSGLQASQRAELSRDATDVRTPTDASTPTATAPSVPASGRAAAAVAYAMAQLHKAYVYGAAGPNAFDCSGLTMRAWGAAGVALPHSSSAQYGMGPHIPESDLQPGDLVFYYSPISHVGMYIGNGMIINAENPSVGVVITSLHSMPYDGAVRPG